MPIWHQTITLTNDEIFINQWVISPQWVKQRVKTRVNPGHAKHNPHAANMAHQVQKTIYHQTSTISCTLVDNKIIDTQM